MKLTLGLQDEREVRNPHSGDRGQHLAQGLDVLTQKLKRTDQGFRLSESTFNFSQGTEAGLSTTLKTGIVMPLPRFRPKIIPEIASRQHNS